jgi:ABC-2 type transport system permease protein
VTGALSAEWRKLRSVRSTFWLLAVAAGGIACAALFVWYASRVFDGATAAHQTRFQAAAPEQGFLPLVQLCLAALGVLAVTGEYATGTMRSSLAVVPRRGVLFAAKAVTVTAVALLAGEVVVFGMFAVGRLIAGHRTMSFNATAVAPEVPHLLAGGLSGAVLALLGLGLGTVLRSTAGAVVSVVALLFVLPTLVGLLPEPWHRRFGSVLPANLVDQLAPRPGPGYFHGVLPPAAAAAVLAGWVLAALLPAAVLLRRRDA